MSTTTAFARSPRIPQYLRVEQEKIEALSAAYGLDFFPVIFEMLTYDQMNEIAAYGGFPEPLSALALRHGVRAAREELRVRPLEDLRDGHQQQPVRTPTSSRATRLTDQKLVMCHVLGHVDFFRNNFMFRPTDLDATGPVIDPTKRSGTSYEPNRKWIDKMANHGAIVRRLVDRHGIDKIESFIDHCLSLENLIDPWAPFVVRSRVEVEDEDPSEVEVPRLRAKEYMESFINPEEYIEEQKKKMTAEREQSKGKFPRESTQDVLSFLVEHAPLERWERSILEVVRERGVLLPAPDADEDHERRLGQLLALAAHDGEGLRRERDPGLRGQQRRRDGDEPGQSEPVQARASSSIATSRSAGTRASSGKEWEDCDDLEVKKHWDLRLGLGRQKVFEVRALYNDVTFIDEFLTPEFAVRHGLFTFEWSSRSDRFEVESREFRKIKDKLLFQLTNRGNPYIYVEDANYGNRGELLLRHQHQGVDLRADYARETLTALVRMWKRPVCVQTVIDGKKSIIRFDGKEHTVKQES